MRKTKKIKRTTKAVKKRSNKSRRKQSIKFPAKILAPVASFLKSNLSRLEKRKKEIDSEDPFKNTSRVDDKASPDADAAEQFGHARTSALKERIDRKIIQTRKALTRVKLGKYAICEDCGKMIDTDRLTVYPETTYCVKCERKREK